MVIVAAVLLRDAHGCLGDGPPGRKSLSVATTDCVLAAYDPVNTVVAQRTSIDTYCRIELAGEMAEGSAAEGVGMFCCCTEASDAPRQAALLAGLAAADVAPTIQELDAIRLDFSQNPEQGARHQTYYGIYSAASSDSIATCADLSLDPCHTRALSRPVRRAFCSQPWRGQNNHPC